MRGVSTSRGKIRFVDLFCGIGGFHIAFTEAAREIGLSPECVFASDIDNDCKKVYHANFGITPYGDITTVDATQVPDHEVLLAGFPCQPFSIIGHRRGFEDTRGTLFFDIARILEAKKPPCFVLENVKLLAGHNQGKTLQRIISVLESLHYKIYFRVLNALDYGLPQKRERIFIVGSLEDTFNFAWPPPMLRRKSLDELLEKDVPQEYYASDYIRKKRFDYGITRDETTIWHENKAGHISAYPYSCALRAGASYNYLLVNGERRLTSREMLRLQGFPDSFKIIGNYSSTRKQAGNSLPVPVAHSVISSLLRQSKPIDDLYGLQYAYLDESIAVGQQLRLLEKKGRYHGQTKNKNR